MTYGFIGSDTEVPDARRLAASTQSGCAIKLPTPIRKSALGLRENPQKSMRSEDMVDPEDLTDNDDEEEEVEHGKAKGATTTKVREREINFVRGQTLVEVY